MFNFSIIIVVQEIYLDWSFDRLQPGSKGRREARGERKYNSNSCKQARQEERRYQSFAFLELIRFLQKTSSRDEWQTKKKKRVGWIIVSILRSRKEDPTNLRYVAKKIDIHPHIRHTPGLLETHKEEQSPSRRQIFENMRYEQMRWHVNAKDNCSDE